MKTIKNIRLRRGRKLGLTVAALAFLPLLLLRPGAGQQADAQAASNQTTYTITDWVRSGDFQRSERHQQQRRRDWAVHTRR